ncbi:hypothetical protein [Clostridium rectalis]|uniref:hypothetical protein n=1 Tax=Clostridium rectalis TaxID=2040295 RepID=UPI000F642D61|nr:hypothetical protein [Clostridium rectalis]
MQEVREAKVLKVNLDSPIFNNVKETLNEKIIEYKALSFKHNITTTFKKVDKEEDTYFSDKGLVEDEDGNFIEKAIGNPQVSLFD